MSKAAMTQIFILVTVIVIAVWDVYVISTGGFETSISHTMIEWSYKYPIFTFLMGVVTGHLFWRMGDSKATQKISDFVHDKDTKLSNKDGGQS